MNILVAGGCDIPPPYGGVASRLLNNAAIWEREHDVHILLPWGKAKPDLLGTTRTRLHAVYPPRPTALAEKVRLFLRRRVPGALTALARKPALSLAVLQETRLLLTARKSYHALGAIVDALTYAATLDDLLAQERIDVIQAHYARWETLLCEVVAARRGVPVVVVTYAEAVCWPEQGEAMTEEALHGVMPQWDPLFRRTFGAAAHICALSQHCAQGPARFVPPDKITVAYSCIDVEALQRSQGRREEVAHELGLSQKKVVLYVGQLTPRKGPQFLAQAAPALLEAEPNTYIVFIGSDIDGYRRELESLVSRHQTAVRFAGPVPNETLYKYYAVADALAFPTYTDRECMGMSMKEALAVGAPVVAFRAGGTPEAVEDRTTGYLVEPGDVSALADRLAAVLRGELGPQASERCREVAERLFDIRAGAAVEYRILAEAVSGALAA